MKLSTLAWACVIGCCWAGTSLAQGVLAPQVPPPEPDKLSRAAASVGVKRCLPAVTRLSTLLLQGSRSHDMLLDWGRAHPDGDPLFSLIGIAYSNGGAAASVTAIPSANGACTVAAERISVAPLPCASVAQQELEGYKVTRLLPIYAVYVNEKEPTSSVSLIDSPPGCLVIRRYVEYDWRQPQAKQAGR
jgi:hypothetical protein